MKRRFTYAPYRVKGENPVSIQLFGSDEDSLLAASDLSRKYPRPISSISTWVPVKIKSSRAGWCHVAQGPRQDLLPSSIKVQSVLDIPSLLKCGRIWSDPSLAVEEIRSLLKLRVSPALAMHGRTREQMYTGHADLETLHRLHKLLTKIPFIANGDIRTVQDAKLRIESRCRAVMIGRAAMGNPYLPQPNQSLL